MSMVVKSRNFFNLREQTLVDLLNVGAGEWARLRSGERCETGPDAGEEQYRKNLFHGMVPCLRVRAISLRLTLSVTAA